MGKVIKIDPADWMAMRFYQDSIKFYTSKPRDNDRYGTALAMEKARYRDMLSQYAA